MRPDSQCGRVLAFLADGRSHSVPAIHRHCGTMRLNSRIAELRSKGHDIVCEHVKGQKGARAYRYTWVDAPPQEREPEPAFSLTTDEIAPRVPSERYRLFRVKNGGPPEIVCTVASPEAVGVALCRLGSEGEWRDYCVGVQDSMSRWEGDQENVGREGYGKYVGQWLVLPWTAGY